MSVPLLGAPSTLCVGCPTCSGHGIVSVNPVRVARECPTCRGSGFLTIGLLSDPMDRRAYELDLHPRTAP